MKVIYIGNQLNKKGLTPTSIETLGVQLQDLNCEIKYASSIKNKFFRGLHMAWVVWRNRKWVDLVLVDTYSSFAFYYCIIVAALCKGIGVPYVPILRGGNLKWRIGKSPKIADFVFKNSYTNIGVSNFLKTTFLEKKYPFTLIPNNVDIQNYSFLQRKNISPTILWVRSFARIYNPNLALDILKLVSEKYPQAQLTMVGPDKDGSMQEFSTYARTLGLEQQVQIMGIKSKEEWREISKNCDIFLNTTTVDNTPISVIEAMALGLPVVSTRVGGVPFIIEDSINGLLFDSGNATQAADHIFQLLTNSEKTEAISKQARKMVENWDWEVIKYQWKELFESVLTKLR